MATLVLVLLLLGAVLSALVRSGAAMARLGAVLAMLAVALAALVPPRAVPVSEPARVGIACSDVPTAHGVEAAVRELAQRAGEGARVATVTSAELPVALARAAMRAGPRTEEIAAVWNGPRASERPMASRTAAAAYTTVAPLPFAPDALSLRALAEPRADRPLRLEASVAGAAAPVRATVTIAAGHASVQHVDAQLPTVGAAAIDAGTPPAGPLELALSVDLGAHRVECSGQVEVAAQRPVVVVEPAGVVAAALRAQGVAVEERAVLPDDVSPFAAVVLGTPLPAAAQQRLAAAVDAGLGLFALGPGLQADGEPLRALWPVRVQKVDGNKTAGSGPLPDAAAPPPPPPPGPQPPVPPTNVNTDGAQAEPGGPAEVDRHAIAMVFVVDRSYSMGARLIGGPTKMSFVKTSAQRTADALGDGDQVAIVTFGNQDQGRVVLPLTAATDRAAVAAGVAQLAHAREYTYLLAGLRAARELLLASSAAVRHIVVLTDGEYVPTEQVPLQSLAHEMRGNGVTVSIVSIVDKDTDPQFFANCENLARDGGGVFLPVLDASRVPQLVSAEVVRTMGRVGREPRRSTPSVDPPPDPIAHPDAEPEAPTPPGDPTPAIDDAPVRLRVRAVAPSPLLLPAIASWPMLLGAVATTATFDAHVLLVAGEQGQPVLAFANRGLGRVGVFAADLAGVDGQEFRAEPAFPARLSQWIAAITPSVPFAPVELLSATAVVPPAPTPSEVAQLAACAGGAPQPFADLRLPPPRTAFAYRSQVPLWATAAVALLVLLAVLEWWSARRAG